MTTLGSRTEAKSACWRFCLRAENGNAGSHPARLDVRLETGIVQHVETRINYVCFSERSAATDLGSDRSDQEAGLEQKGASVGCFG
jgi:hypothetical protein